MNHCSARGWQLQVAQSGTQSNLLAWHNGALMLGFWSGTERPELAHQAISDAFDQPPRTLDARHALLSGQGANERPAQGRIVCSCFSVGEEAIRRRLPGDVSRQSPWRRTALWHQLRLLHSGAKRAAGAVSGYS